VSDHLPTSFTGQNPDFVGLGAHLTKLGGPENIGAALSTLVTCAIIVLLWGVLSQTKKIRPCGRPRNQTVSEVTPNGMYTGNTWKLGWTKYLVAARIVRSTLDPRGSAVLPGDQPICNILPVYRNNKGSYASNNLEP
jgi:hypothetical protein